MKPVQRGDVVLVPFPFSSLSSTKIRPAVVVSTSDYFASTGELIVAMITSQSRTGRTDCEIRDWSQANLLHRSWFRCKLATLSPNLIRMRPGRLSFRDIKAIDRILSRALGLERTDAPV